MEYDGVEEDAEPACRLPGRPSNDPSGPANPRRVRLSPAAVGHVAAVYGNFNKGIVMLVRMSMAISAEDRRTLVMRHGSLTAGVLAAVRREVGEAS